MLQQLQAQGWTPVLASPRENIAAIAISLVCWFWLLTTAISATLASLLRCDSVVVWLSLTAYRL